MLRVDSGGGAHGRPRMSDHEAGARRLATEEEERLVRDLFPIGTMSPGEYMARHGDPRGSCGYGALRYRAETVGRWLDAVDAIAASPALLARVRARWAGSPAANDKDE